MATNFGWDLPAGITLDDIDALDRQAHFYPTYRVGGQWYRFSERGQDVAFASEQDAAEYLRGVAGETRIECDAPHMPAEDEAARMAEAFGGASEDWRDFWLDVPADEPISTLPAEPFLPDFPEE